ncbi:MAG TPA: tail fiber domain-containing protein, partial [Chitinophagaceae bacterium]|nr:tail fiber domain-containing protein [Chitinophagaceae bacterium]
MKDRCICIVPVFLFAVASMRIDGSGNVGIGTTAPAQKFHVNGGNARITNGGISLDIMVGTTFSGITIAAGMAYYEIACAEYHMFGGTIKPDADNGWSCGTSAKRWTAVYAANGTIQTSDVRLKKSIDDLLYVLAEVLKLRPVSYYWKDNSGSKKIGLIAQEVRKVIPEVVV